MTSSETKQKIMDKFCIHDRLNHTLFSAMTISRERKTLFYHIAKTGGSSMYRLLVDNELTDHIIDNVKLSYACRQDYFKEIVADWDSYTKITFVRNKYHQLVSNYHYDKLVSLNNCSFEEFIEEHVIGKSDLYPTYDYWLDQHFLTTVDDKSIFDFVGQFENYTEDAPLACEYFGIPYTDVRANIGTYDRQKSYNEYYTPEIKKAVDDKFQKEIEYFKWSLE